MDYLETIKCPVCGKVFCIWDRDIYQWKLNEELYCSYTCMRKEEKKALEREKSFADFVPEKEKLPDEYKEVYIDLLKMRKMSRTICLINMIKLLNPSLVVAGSEPQRTYRKCLYRMGKIRAKYVEGVEKLNKQQFDILSLYILKFLDIEDICEGVNLEYKQICDIFISLMKILKENQSSQTERNRWRCVER